MKPLILLLVLFSGCSTTQETTKEDDILNIGFNLGVMAYQRALIKNNFVVSQKTYLDAVAIADSAMKAEHDSILARRKLK